MGGRRVAGRPGSLATMPAVSKGDGMRGLAVFISDIRNCEWRLRRGGAGLGLGRAGPVVARGREAGAVFPRFPPQCPPPPPAVVAAGSPSCCFAKWRRAPGGGGGGGAGGAARGPWLCVWAGLCLLRGSAETFPSVSLPGSPRRCAGLSAPLNRGAQVPVPPVCEAAERSLRGVWRARVGLRRPGERRARSRSTFASGSRLRTSLMDSRPL